MIFLNYDFYQNKIESLNKIASPIIKLEDNDIVYAQISLESYIALDQRKKQIGGLYLDEKYSTENVCIYQSFEQEICIIGYRGTIFTDIKDVVSDAQIVLDIQGIDPRVKSSLDIYDNIKREYQGYIIGICGHSLGGTLAYIVAKHRNPNRCVVFNPGASLNTFFVQMIEDTLKKTERTQKTYTYKILGDIISTLAFVGHTKVFTIGVQDPIKLHAISNFII